MPMPAGTTPRHGQWAALVAAFLGWMFDGLEMGLFPLVARPALLDLLGLTGKTGGDEQVGKWMGIITASFLVGAAAGGILFGWLGDRIGRVRAMTLSVLCYALFSGMCGLVSGPIWIVIFRFIAALGMGGEWGLGVALVMEIWPNQSRVMLAGLIGAAANVGYLLIALIGLGLSAVLAPLQTAVAALGVLSPEQVAWLTRHDGWRILMLCGALPGLLTFFIRIFVPESQRWEAQRQRGLTAAWANSDLWGVLFGSAAGIGMIGLWVSNAVMTIRLPLTALCFLLAAGGFLFPIFRYLGRASAGGAPLGMPARQVIGRMILGGCLGGVALLGTWGTIQWIPSWADQLVHSSPGWENQTKTAKSYAQIVSALGAILGTLSAARLGDWLGRRWSYALLCTVSLASTAWLFQYLQVVGPLFFFAVFVASLCTASFYGWFPLYLPELFPTAVRATGQGFSFNFGRIIAAGGALSTSYLMQDVFAGSYPKACAVISLVYVAGFVVIAFAPETSGKPLPE